MSVVFEVMAPRLLGPALMVAAALIVKGYVDVGEGFSAGVIVALALALRYVALGPEQAERALPVLRYAAPVAAAGLLVVLAVGFLGLAFGDPPLTHYPLPGEPVTYVGSLELTTAVVFDAGLFLLVTGSLAVLLHQLASLVHGSER